MPLIIAAYVCTVHAPKNKARRASNFERKDLEINWKPVPEKTLVSKTDSATKRVSEQNNECHTAATQAK